MFVRLVKMSFNEADVDTFLANFEAYKQRIRAFPGCRFLELYRDKQHPHVFFTYSHWQSESDLEHYRNSDLFKEVWSLTKPLFSAKPEAWSVDKLHSLN